MDAKKELAWGETPWDGLTPDELRRECQRLYAAVESARSALAVMRCHDPASLFWSKGTGGRAHAKCELALSRSPAARYESGDVYGSFFRYAADLLFTPELGAGWHVCGACGTLLANPEGPAPDRCGQPDCPQPKMRPITWGDLKPVEKPRS